MANPDILKTEGATTFSFDEILAKAKNLYGYIDTIFSMDPELKAFLEDAVLKNKSSEQFAKELTSTKWYITNGATIQARGFSKRQYDSLVKGISKDDPDYINKVKAVAGDTDYWRGLDTTVASIEAQLVAKGISYTPADLNAWAAELYDTGNEKNVSYIARWLNTKIGFASATKGTGATDMADLTAYAQDQGLDVNKDFSQSDIGSWLQRLDKGESLDAIKKEIETRARIGESESVQNLMNQGLSRKTIYSSLVNRFNTKLQRADGTMNDPWLQANAKDEKGNLLTGYALDMKIMADPTLDWDKTDEAQDTYSNYTLRILKDFGLTGGR